MTEFFDWSCRHFAQSVTRMSDEHDPESMSHHRQEFKLLRAQRVRHQAIEEQRRAGNYDNLLKIFNISNIQNTLFDKSCLEIIRRNISTVL
jgi:hypothetical protein